MRTNLISVLIPELVRRTGFNNIRLGKWAYEKWIWRNVFVWYSDLFDLIYHIILNNDSQETSAKNEWPIVIEYSLYFHNVFWK